MVSVIPTDELVKVLGEYEDSPVLQALLGRLGAQLRPQRDDTQLSFVSHPNYGLSFAYEDEATLLRKNQPLGGRSLLSTVHLYSEGFENYHQYRQPLPGNVSFQDGRDEVRGKLGPPSASGGGKRALGRVWPSWDRYDFDNYSMSVQYSSDFGRVDLISLIAPVKAKALAAKS
jgi:hypothetical protein